MAGRGRNVFSILLSNIFNSLKPRKFRGELVGKDHFGNKYFEVSNASKRTSSRWFEPLGGEKNFDQELPAEWEAWLRGRRKTPPTEEEVLKNLNLSKAAKLNADALEAEFKPSEQAQKPPSGNVPFPKHAEYEIHPGEKSEKN